MNKQFKATGMQDDQGQNLYVRNPDFQSEHSRSRSDGKRRSNTAANTQTQPGRKTQKIAVLIFDSNTDSRQIANAISAVRNNM